MFTREQRSTFPYWFAHWCAFNMTALNCGAWKFKYLFHDFEKPWMKLFMSYPTVQHWHRTHNRHHLEYPGVIDVEAMLIDWECSRFTKTTSPRTAREEWEVEKKDINTDFFILHPELYAVEPILNKLGL